MPAPAIPLTNIVEAAAIMAAAFIAAGPPSIAAARLPEAAQYEAAELAWLTMVADAADAAVADIRFLGRRAPSQRLQSSVLHSGDPRGGPNPLRALSPRIKIPHKSSTAARVVQDKRKPWLGLMACLMAWGAAMTVVNAPAAAVTLTKSSIVLPVQYIRECYFTQSSSGGFTIEQCYRFLPWRFYDVPLHRRFRKDGGQ
jgi:hypothetical protein